MATEPNNLPADTVAMRTLWCRDFPAAPPCCEDCHDDFADGYDQHSEVDLGDGVTAFVCCHVLHWLEKQAEHNDGAERAD